MYLIGADLTAETDVASMVLVQRVRKELRKYYHLTDMKRSLCNSTNQTMIEEIYRIYNDPNYTIRKPRFSQAGRPKKIVNERPLIFLACTDASLEYIYYLKEKKIPAICVFVTDGEKWQMEASGKCLKNDFFIPKHNLIQTLLDVIEQKRLIPYVDGNELDKAIREYRNVMRSSFKVDDKRRFDGFVLALAMLVWYYENLLSIRPRTP